MNNVLISALIYLSGVIASSFSQIALKKSAGKKYDKWYQEYMNPRVILAYGVFFAATLCSVFAYRYLPLSVGAILGTSEYLFVATLSFFLLKERVGKMKFLGLAMIILGVLIYTL